MPEMLSFAREFFLLFPRKFSESNRFNGESQKLCGDIFMAGVVVLVYSIQLVTTRQATFAPADSEFAARVVCLPRPCEKEHGFFR